MNILIFHTFFDITDFKNHQECNLHGICGTKTVLASHTQVYVGLGKQTNRRWTAINNYLQLSLKQALGERSPGTYNSRKAS